MLVDSMSEMFSYIDNPIRTENYLYLKHNLQLLFFQTHMKENCVACSIIK